MPGWAAVALIVFNLGLIFLLIAAPVGVRAISRTVRIAAPADRVWEAIYPLGSDAGWSGEILSAEPDGELPDQVQLVVDWDGRDGLPIRRVAALSEVSHC